MNAANISAGERVQNLIEYSGPVVGFTGYVHRVAENELKSVVPDDAFYVGQPSNGKAVVIASSEFTNPGSKMNKRNNPSFHFLSLDGRYITDVVAPPISDPREKSPSTYAMKHFFIAACYDFSLMRGNNPGGLLDEETNEDIGLTYGMLNSEVDTFVKEAMKYMFEEGAEKAASYKGMASLNDFLDSYEGAVLATKRAMGNDDDWREKAGMDWFVQGQQLPRSCYGILSTVSVSGTWMTFPRMARLYSGEPTEMFMQSMNKEVSEGWEKFHSDGNKASYTKPTFDTAFNYANLLKGASSTATAAPEPEAPDGGLVSDALSLEEDDTLFE